MGIAAVIGGGYYAWMLSDRRRQKEEVDFEWFDFMEGVKSNNIEQMLLHGNKVIWNWHLSPERRRIMLKELGQRKDEHPELDELWREVHNRTLGHYPPE